MDDAPVIRPSPTGARPDAFLRTGAGAPVLLLHPFALSHHVWREVAAGLSESYEVFAPTLPGHWGGPRLRAAEVDLARLADGVEAMLDRNGWPDCHVVGNSLGGWLAFELARRGRARTVTAIAPAGGWTHLAPAAVRLGAWFAVRYPAVRLLAARSADRPVLRDRFLRAICQDLAAVPAEDVRSTLAAMAGCRGYLPFLWSSARTGGVTGLDRTTCPVHLVLCDRDRLLPPRRFAGHFLDRLPGAEVTTLDRVGHVPMLENPGLVTATVRDFLDRHR